MYIKFFCAASDTNDGGISEDDAEATEGAGRSYETENENIRAGGDTRTAQSDDDDDDFQAGTSVRPGRDTRAGGAGD